MSNIYKIKKEGVIIIDENMLPYVSKSLVEHLKAQYNVETFLDKKGAAANSDFTLGTMTGAYDVIQYLDALSRAGDAD